MIIQIHKSLLITLTILVFCSLTLFAQEPEQTYKLPPQALIDIADAPFTPRVSLSPDNEYMLLLNYPGLPSIEEVSQPELRLAGLRINHRTNGPSRDWYYDDLTIKKISDGIEKPVTGLPEKRHFTNVSWSSDSKKVAFTNTTSEGLYLWILDIEKGEVSQISDLKINDAMGYPFSWLSDNKTLICKTIPSDRGEAPVKPLVPVGPVIQENLGSKRPARTYQDLLKNEYDESVFDYYSTSQLAKISIDGQSTLIGSPQIYSDATPSPDGKYLLIETLHKPYSYAVPFYYFPLKSEIWDIDGNPVTLIADLPLADNIPVPFGSTRTGRRSISWRADAKATLYWVEALDDGDGGKEVDLRDEVYLLPAPFDKDPISLIKLNLRFNDIKWGDDKLALVSSSWWKTRQTKTWRVKPGSPGKKPELIVDRSSEDRYSDPGDPLMTESKYGTSILLTADNGNTLFLSGNGASPEGDIPFLNEFNLTTKKTTKLFQSEAPYYESIVRLLNADNRTLLTRRESVTEQPNYFIRNLKKEELTQVTEFPHPTPQLKDVQKEQLRYERADGVQLTATLYLPAG
ncbi:MAG: S9 family peptidase, partial [bacterium]